jgi:gluconolactonase
MDLDTLYQSRIFTSPGMFTSGIEGPACDQHGNIYAVNFARNGTIGMVSPEGLCGLFLELPEGSTGNGIRFDSFGNMLVADYTGHNILTVDMVTRSTSVYAHNDDLYQPNDIAIGVNNIIYASDPDWSDACGRIWRIGLDRRFVLLADGLGTTNGIEVSPDEHTLYVNETVQRNIWAFDLSSSGEISNKRLLINFSDYALDGMRCDIAGDLYVTRTEKGVIAKISSEGELLLEIPLYGKDCTNLTFGGPDGRTCYVTMADNGSIESFRVEHPGRLTPPGRRNVN